jgi:hypothetical protein
MNHLKLALALAGFLLAVLSVALDEKRLAWIAIALLIGSLMLRLWLRGRDRDRPGADEPL